MIELKKSDRCVQIQRFVGFLWLAMACSETIAPLSPQVVWKTPVALGGVRPAADSTLAYFASDYHELIALDRANGRVRWRKHSGSGGEFTAGSDIVAARDVAVLADVALVAFDRKDGHIRWRFQPNGFTPGRSSLTTDGSRVFAGSPQGKVFAVDALTGDEVWSTAIDDAPAYGAFGPVLFAGTLYVGLGRATTPGTGGIVALDARTGIVVWKRIFPSSGALKHSNGEGNPVVSDSVVVAANGGGEIHALRRSSGEILWTAPALPETGTWQGDIRPLALSGNIVIAGSSSGIVTAYSLSSGAQLWKTDPRSGSVIYPFSTDGRLLYYVGAGGDLRALNAETGALTWEFNRVAGRRTEARFAPRLIGDTLFVSTTEAGYAIRVSP